jgi:hypothetical protein
MCAIIGSFNQQTLEELVEINSYRGQHSYSISEYDLENCTMNTRRKCLGSFSLQDIELRAGMYYVAHIQAPTTAASAIDSIHPSVRAEGRDLLWHNGIIKEECVKDLQVGMSSSQSWDTGLIHDWIREGNQLDAIDGTYSCLRYVAPSTYSKGAVFLFRNEISPMFVDGKLNISSTKFEGSHQTKPNTMYKVNFNSNELEEAGTFKTKNNPYYFG